MQPEVGGEGSANLPEVRPGRGDFSIGSETWPGLGKLAEEAGEVLQVIGKLIGSHGSPDHWDETNLIERLEKEMADVQAAIWFVLDANTGLSKKTVRERAFVKLKKFHYWHNNEVPVSK